MSFGQEALLLTGNHAVSHAARLAKPRVIPIYPITPQTPIAEKLTEFQLRGELDAEFITPESEHSTMAACIAASLTGVRVFTATSSQGLLLMHELLHYASGARAPIVMANVNRTVASPWGFWADQTDSLAQRDTGWIQYYTESPQEALDTVLEAFFVAEKTALPAMVIFEAFYVSHSLEIVEVPSQETVDSFLPPYNPAIKIDPDLGRSWGNVVDQAMYCRHRRDLGRAMDEVFPVASEAGGKWKELSGRRYGIMEKYRTTGAETLLVTMGSIAGTAKVAVDQMRAEGIAVGLVRIRLFRPFPAEILQGELEGARRVIVLDRNFSPGCGGILHQEVKAALCGMKQAPVVYGYLAGVGGVNVSLSLIRDLVQRTPGQECSNKSQWVGDECE